MLHNFFLSILLFNFNNISETFSVYIYRLRMPEVALYVS